MLKPVSWGRRKMRPKRKPGSGLEHQMSPWLHGRLNQNPHSCGKLSHIFLVDLLGMMSMGQTWLPEDQSSTITLHHYHHLKIFHEQYSRQISELRLILIIILSHCLSVNVQTCFGRSNPIICWTNCWLLKYRLQFTTYY